MRWSIERAVVVELTEMADDCDESSGVGRRVELIKVDPRIEALVRVEYVKRIQPNVSTIA